jgi:hypothetical protein
MNQLQQAYKDLIKFVEYDLVFHDGYEKKEYAELRAKIAELEAKEEDDSHMLFHECPNCNCRCNCTDHPCSCCDEAKEEPKVIPYLKSEQEFQIIAMRALGINYPENGHTFEQCINSVLMMAKKKEEPIQSALDFWKSKFDEYPQTDADKLAVAMMAEYASQFKQDKPKI